MVRFRMYVIAIAELNTTIESEATALALDLGITAYEARLVLAAGTPAIVCTTSEKSQALDLLARLRTRGHRALGR